MDKQTIYCPNCQKKYRIDARAKKGQLRCKDCNHSFRLEECLAGTEDISDWMEDDEFGPPIAPKPVVAQPVVAQLDSVAEQNSTRRKRQAQSTTTAANRDWLVPAVVAAMFLSVAAFGGVLLWNQSERGNVVVSDNEINLNHALVGKDFSNEEISKSTNANSIKNRGNESRKAANWKKTNSKIASLEYDFPTANWIRYSYSLRGGSGRNAIDFSGTTSYKRFRKGEVSAESATIGHEQNLTKFDRLEYKGFAAKNPTSSYLERNMGSPSGHFRLDSNQQPSNDWTLDSELTIPFMVIPASRAGIVPLGKGQLKWNDEKQLTVEYATTKNSSRYSKHGFAKPRVLPDVPSMSVFPNGRAPGARGQRGTMELKRIVDYEIESQTTDTTEIVAKLVVKTVGQDRASFRLKVDCAGVIRFDNKSKILLSQEWSGNVEFVGRGNTMKLPIKFICKLDSKGDAQFVSNASSLAPRRFGNSSNARNSGSDMKMSIEDALERMKESREQFDEMIDEHLADGEIGIDPSEFNDLHDQMEEMLEKHVEELTNPFQDSASPFRDIPESPGQNSATGLAKKATPRSREPVKPRKKEPVTSHSNENSQPVLKKKSNIKRNNATNLVWESDELGWGIDSLDFAESGLLYAGEMDRAVTVFDLENGTQLDQKSELDELGHVLVSTVTPNGKYLLTGGSKGRIQIWEIGDDGKLTMQNTFRGHTGGIRSIAVSADSRLVLSGSGDNDNRARIWDLSTCREKFVFEGFSRRVSAATFSRDGKHAVASDGNFVLKADVSSGSIVGTGNLGNTHCHAAEFSPDGQFVAVSVGKEVQVYEVQTLRKQSEFKFDGSQWSLKFGPTGKYLYTGCDRIVVRWDWRNSSKVDEFEVSKETNINAIAVSSGGKYLAAIGSSAGQKLRVFEIPGD